MSRNRYLLVGTGLSAALLAVFGLHDPSERLNATSQASPQTLSSAENLRLSASAPAGLLHAAPLVLHQDHGVDLQIDAAGRATLSGRSGTANLVTAAVHRGGRRIDLTARGVSTGEVPVGGEGLRIDHGSADTWFRGTGNGIQQGWTLQEIPGDGALTIDVHVDGLAASVTDDGQRITLGTDGFVGTDLLAWDADGDPLAVHAVATDDGYAMVVDVDAADWPIHVDPTWEDAGGSVTGAGSNNAYGTNVSPLGDVDGDGIHDFLVASPGSSGGGINRGKLWVYHGAADGPEDTADWTWSPNQNGLRVGEHGSIAYGDINGDGYNDLAVGSPDWYGSNGTLGRVWIFHGSSTGLSSSPDDTLDGVQDGADFGQAVAIGDFDGDGYDDLAVGEPQFETQRLSSTYSGAGRVRIYYGTSTGIDTVSTTAIVRNISDLNTGFALAAGHFTGDGYDDLAVGIPGASDGLTNEGKVAIHKGSASGLSTGRVRAWDGGQAQLRMGTHVSNVGDVNGDGLHDIGVGAWKYDGGESHEGLVQVFLGGQVIPEATADFEFESDQIDAELGTIRSAGDVDGDGYGDVLIGAGLYDTTLTDAGRVWLHFGSSTGLSSTADETFDGDTAGDELGGRGRKDTAAVGSAGDINGDGHADILLGAPAYSSDKGQVTLRYGTPNGTSDTPPERTDPPEITAWSMPDGDENTSISFSVTATDPDNGTLTYKWTFGDGTTSTTEDPTHTYADDGAYWVTVTVTDDDDYTDSITERVVVANLAPVITSVTAPSGSSGTDLAFSVTATDVPSDTLSYAWDFGDGDTSDEQDPTHSYAADGIYDVTVTVSDEDGGETSETHTVVIGTSDPTIDSSSFPSGDEGSDLAFSASATDPAGGTLTYSWDFGDGTTGSGASVTHAYADDGDYDATLTVTTASGGEATTTATVEVANVAPTIDSLTTPDGEANNAVGLSASASDPGDDTLTYSWDFGDGTTGSGASVSKTWTSQGDYTVTLTVSDEDGGETVQTRTVTIDPDPSANTAPEVELDDFTGTEGSAVTFDADVTDAQGDSYTLLWNFGDGTLAYGDTPDHTYDDDGTWTVTVTATDAQGASTVATAQVVIDNVAPTGVLTTEDQGDEGESLYFAVIATDPGDDTISISWDFGDGSAEATSAITSHTFTDDGSYTVTLTLTDEDGGETTYEVPVTVDNVAPAFQQPLSVPAVAYEGVDYDATLTATDPGDDAFTYTLVTGPDGMTLDDATGEITWVPSYDQALEGSASVTVKVTDDEGAEAEVSWEITIHTADSDGDGMADTWEEDNGLNPDDPADASLDGDMDGRTNLQEFEGGTDPSLYEGPSIPTPIDPEEGERVDTPIPMLRWDGTHPLNEPMTYTIELYQDEELLALFTDVQVEGDEFWLPTVELPEDGDIWWRVQASDAYTSSEWSVVSHFFVSAEQSAPTVPVPMFPIDGETLGTVPGLLQWSISTDEDRDELTYEVRLQTFDGAPLYDDGAIRAEDEAIEVEHLLPEELLEEGGEYQWAVRAVDDTNMMSEWSEWQDFRFQSVLAPDAVDWINPEPGSQTSTGPTLTVTMPPGAGDVDLAVVFELSTDPTFELGPEYTTTIEVDPAAEDVSWSLFSDFIVLSGGVWHARAQVVDAFDQASPWSSVSFEVIDSANRPVEGQEGCGCSSTGSGTALGWLGVLGLMGLRRRRR